jgi:hypothetical protein
MVFLVIKEFEPPCADSDFKQNQIDNTVYIFAHSLTGDFHMYVNRKDVKQTKFVPYHVSFPSVKRVIEFLHFILFFHSLIQVDAYHCDRNLIENENKGAAEQIAILSNYTNERYNVVGFNREAERGKSSRLIVNALKCLKYEI